MWEILLYTRKDCCLCEEMKEVIRKVAGEISFEMKEIDVDSAPDIQEKYGTEVPVLFINGRKAFKYRVTERELKKRLQKGDNMRKRLRFISTILLFVATLGITGCFHDMASGAAEAVRDAVKKRTN